MTPAAIDRVFGRGRLRMVTGDHVEVFREESQPGERRRYTKRFLATPAGDFRQWTEREWRILARLVGHGIGPVPDVVQFDRGAGGRQALVQTYDAGVTIDHWTTLLPVQRDGETRAHVFEDCAHWWALARHSLVALDAIHELQLVHLDLKADNVCIPVARPSSTRRAGARLHPEFERIALIDFAFSLVSAKPRRALPIARQTEFDTSRPACSLHSSRAAAATVAHAPAGTGAATSAWRRCCPLLPSGQAEAGGWTAARQPRRARWCAACSRRTTPSCGDATACRADRADRRRASRSGARRIAARAGCSGAQHGPDDDSPTRSRASPAVKPAGMATDVISIDPGDVEGWAAANPPPRSSPRRRAWSG